MEINATPRNVGLAGCALMALGVFMPILSVPIMGSVNYIQSGGGDGVFVLIAAVGGAVACHRGSKSGAVVTGGIAALIMIFTYVNIQLRLGQMRDAVKSEDGSMFAGLGEAMAQSVQMQWGWLLLIIGVGLLLYAGFNLSPKTPVAAEIVSDTDIPVNAGEDAKIQEVPLGLAIAVGVLPLIFGWVVLAGKYSKTDRINAGGWMGVSVVLGVVVTVLLSSGSGVSDSGRQRAIQDAAGPGIAGYVSPNASPDRSISGRATVNPGIIHFTQDGPRAAVFKITAQGGPVAIKDITLPTADTDALKITILDCQPAPAQLAQDNTCTVAVTWNGQRTLNSEIHLVTLVREQNGQLSDQDQTILVDAISDNSYGS